MYWIITKLPINIINQLSDGGVLILPLEYENDQYITKVIKKNRKLYFKKYWKVRFVPLVSGINWIKCLIFFKKIYYLKKYFLINLLWMTLLYLFFH